ncbi:HAMP domain-containing methyl-accepting chemotaxis protein [Bacillus sp. NEB1478]|uniref:methyl-accepting chemotaxis protein n=1 Tax=Bacillus sp. NEB1478 TaxID=3073816 RepID=UPI002872C98A|nr:HAMP domain-containing methyl-accepting chemotaxis protein [Bacillus sp. NEB1478]WNB91317.1 HAMP domain-containing methyl-accepting chemotaxis protein [Bacillus sp. NEB1478]
MKLTLRKKLIGSFLTIAVLFAATCGVFFYFLKDMQNTYNDLLDRRAVISENAKEIELMATIQNNSIREYLLDQSSDSKSKLEEASAKIDQLVVETLKMVKAEADKNRLEKIQTLNTDYKNESNRVLLNSSSSMEAANTYASSTLFPIGKEMIKVTDEMANRQDNLMAEGKMDVAAAEKQVVSIITILGIAIVIAAVVIGYIISRMIAKPVVKMADMLNDIADGDLTMDPIQIKNKDEIGMLAEGINHMGMNLAGLIRQVRATSEQLAASSEELSASADQTSLATEQIATTIGEVAGGSQEQVRTVENIVEAMNQLSAGIQQISVSMQTMSESSSKSLQVAEGGNTTIRKTIGQMDAIHTSISNTSEVVKNLGEQSQEITNIVDVITDISGQTNLLALNAAIEAARAGEQGRGFAVVADEVRKLAEQSSSSAQQIGQLITSIQELTDQAVKAMESGTEEVASGRNLVHESGAAFQSLFESVAEVSNQVGEISAATQQMSASTEHVVHSIEVISHMAETAASSTQEVSASAEEQLASMEEISSSSNALSQLAEEMNETINKFKV